MNAPAGDDDGSCLTSVVLACVGQLDPTRRCLEALFRRTRTPWELIVVEAGSSDDIGTYLRGIQAAADRRVVIVSQSEHPSLSAAFERGLAEARGRYLALLDDHAIVTEGWLDALIALLEAGPTIGMAGVMSNEGSPPQLVEPVHYEGLAAMHQFAAIWRDENRGLHLDVSRISGPCLLARREAFDVAGGLVARPGPGSVDDGLAARMQRVGYTLAVAREVFVHQDARLQDVGEAGGEPNLGFDRSTRPTVSLTMIVRDEESNLGPCLASVEGLFDEIIVVDTGSGDRTVEVARSFGARVFDFPWVDDFAAARNAALARARGDYAFWLDAGDVIDSHQRPKFESLFERLGRVPGARALRRITADESPGRAAAAAERVRLFPVHQDIRWDYRAGEKILPALRRAGVEVREFDAAIRRSVPEDRETRRRKLERDRKCLEADLADRPSDPYIAHHLGLIALDCDDPVAALAFLRQGLTHARPSYPLARQLSGLIVEAHKILGELDEAVEACEAALALSPGDPELEALKTELLGHEVAGERVDRPSGIEASPCA